MLQATTALRKIANLKKRIWVIQGGQGAGKTFSILVLIVNHCLGNSEKEVFIASDELTKMRITVIKDFVTVLKLLGIYDQSRFTGGTFYRFSNGSFIKFIGLDKEDIGKGLRSDLIFINEANKVNFETYREITSRAKRIIIDFNPNSQFWAHEHVIPREDADYLQLTYNDNEQLSAQERSEIERYKAMAYLDPNLELYDIDSNVKSKYWRNKWHVYGLGITGSNPNRIFFWNSIPDHEYHKIQGKKYYAVDWGTVDPWAILEAKYYDGNLYLHELNYKSENEIRQALRPEELRQIEEGEEGLVKWMFSRLNIPKQNVIVCDPNREMKIITLRQMGYDYAIKAHKPPGSIIDGIDLLNGLNVHYTESSKNIAFEQENYQREVDRYNIVLEEPMDKDNHLCDSARYVATFLQMQGIIRKI